jgi:hypothetical protein
MHRVDVTQDGRVVLIDDKNQIDVWAFLEPDARARVATFLLNSTRLSGKIDASTISNLRAACEHRLEQIEKFETT